VHMTAVLLTNSVLVRWVRGRVRCEMGEGPCAAVSGPSHETAVGLCCLHQLYNSCNILSDTNISIPTQTRESPNAGCPPCCTALGGRGTCPGLSPGRPFLSWCPEAWGNISGSQRRVRATRQAGPVGVGLHLLSAQYLQQGGHV